jgi:hypothetical protein
MTTIEPVPECDACGARDGAIVYHEDETLWLCVHQDACLRRLVESESVVLAYPGEGI